MSKIFRAILISAFATGVAAVALTLLKPEQPPKARPSATPPSPEIEADDLTEEQRSLLLEELEQQV